MRIVGAQTTGWIRYKLLSMIQKEPACLKATILSGVRRVREPHTAHLNDTSEGSLKDFILHRFLPRQRRVSTRGLRRRFIARSSLFLLLLTLAPCQGSNTSVSGAVGGQDLMDLLSGLQNETLTFPKGIEEFLTGSRSAARKDPNWPILTYLLGEAHRLRGETERARDAFRGLASWGVSDYPNGPYKDTWGGSGLAIVGLWRWLQILDEHGPTDADQLKQILDVASQLQETRLYSGMIQAGMLPALPLMAEDVARRLAHVAWKNGHAEAISLFLDFLTINSGHELEPIDQEIHAEILRRNLVDPERLQLFRAKRLLSLVKTREQQKRAAKMLKELWDNRQWPADIRAEAGYEWANYNRMQSDRGQLVEILTEVLELAEDQRLAEKALYRRGLVHNRGRREEDTELFRADMLELLHRFPRGQLSDDAIFQQASEYLFDADLENALSNFEKLQNLPWPHDYQDSAYYLPALGLIGRSRDSDLDLAEQLLDKYVKRYPDGIFRLRCLFWRGRIAEKRNDDHAWALFRQVVDEAPYDYYAVRARMHLEEGISAISKDLPDFDSQTRQDLAAAYRASGVDTQLLHSSPYHARLQVAKTTGFYRRLLEVEQSLSKRLDDVPLQQLDSAGLIPSAVLLLAFRQDALAAKDSAPAADNWLRLAGLLGHEIQDWPVAIEMISVGNLPWQRITNLHNDARYLATVYPDPVHLKTLSLEQPLASAAWPIEGSSSLSQSLMYAVIRHESRFYPRAISPVGALGLFQFMPYVFKRLNHRWNLLQNSSARSGVEYLLAPEKNIQLWARWVNAEIGFQQRDDFAIALMKHQAGAGNVRAWHSYWEKLGLENDIEYRIETARFNVTRNFVRRTLQDIVIVEATGFFEDRPAN